MSEATKSGLPDDSESRHRVSVEGARDRGRPVRRMGCRDEEDAIEPKFDPSALRRPEVTQVHRVEGASEEPEPQESAPLSVRASRRCRRITTLQFIEAQPRHG